MKNLLVAMLAIATIFPVFAVPAKPGIVKVTQSDGTVIGVETVGDEHHHFMQTVDGVEISRSKMDGNYYYVGKDGISNMLAHDKADRSAQEVAFIDNVKVAVEENQANMMKEMSRKVKSTVKKVAQVACKGTVRIPILLVEYADQKMTFSKSELENHFNVGANSVRQYFIDQSNGKFVPQFDVYGVYTLDNDRAVYGANNTNGSDVGVGRMVSEACQLANATSGVNWKNYDNDGDNKCDVVIVVYAGVGEAQASTTVPESIWPCQWSLSGAGYCGDGDGAALFNGVTVDKFAVFNELGGSSDKNANLDGIGTFCHEFSHCLGLPDFYETTYKNGYYGMGFWSIMCRGCYNNDGHTPIGYSAYEKSFLGWVSLETPTEGATYNMPVMNAGNDRAIKIVSDVNANEYYVLENRRKQGWDAYIKDEGLMISHVTYVATRWSANNVNDAAVQLMTIAPADGSADLRSEAGDLFGETNHSFTDISTPAAKLNLADDKTNSYPAGNGGFLGKPVTNIQIEADGTVSFVYCDKTAPKMDVDDSEVAFGKVIKGNSLTQKVTLSGKNIHSATTLEVTDGAFILSKSSISADEMNAGVTVDVKFAPKDFNEHKAVIKVSNADCAMSEIAVSGTGCVDGKLPVMKDVDNNDVTTTSFVAAWDDATASEDVESYAFRVSSEREPSLIYDADFSGMKKVVNSAGGLVNAAFAAIEYLPEGWTISRGLYVVDGALVFGGNINTTSYNMDGYDKVSIVVKGRSFKVSSYGDAELTASTSKGNATITMGADMDEYTIVLPCAEAEQLKFTTSSYPTLESIKVYGGDVTKKNVVSETGDAAHRLITGIADKTVEVEDLNPSTQYSCQVKTYYKDGTTSEWSSVKNVTTKSAPVSLMAMFDKLEVGENVDIPSGQLSCVGLLGSNILITKDENACPSKDMIAPGQVDFLMSCTNFMSGDVDYDQSGWMLVELENELTLSQYNKMMGRKLSSVKGVVADVENPTITVNVTPDGDSESEAAYAQNTYIVANFKGTQQSKTKNADGTYTTYFFVQPKPNEIASIHWAMWNEALQCFTVPTNVGGSNKAGLEGCFRADFSKYNGTKPTLKDGEVYSFTGLITVGQDAKRAARRAAADGDAATIQQTDYMVYPLGGWSIDGSISDNVMTDINDVQAGKEVAEVVYYNMLGVKSATPFSGINVVVTTYTDGTTSTAKVRK